MDHLPWAFLERILFSDMTWKQAAEYARDSGNFVVTWYSEEAPPCPFRYLEGMLNAIVIVACTRCGMSGSDIRLWFEKMKSAVLESGVRATSIAPVMFKQRPDAILDCALCYWVQAAIAYDAMESNVCSGSMMQSNFYLGMAAGPKLASEMNSAIGSQRTAHLEDLAKELKRLLEKLSFKLGGKKLPNISKILDHVRDELVEFHEKQITEMRAHPSRPSAKPTIIVNMDAYVRKICTPDHEYYGIVRAEFERVCEGRKGRPVGSRNLLRR